MSASSLHAFSLSSGFMSAHASGISSVDANTHSQEQI